MCFLNELERVQVWSGATRLGPSGGGDTKTTRRSDNWARSQSAQSRRYMFGKGGQGTAATLIPAKLSVRSGSDVTERSEESVRLGDDASHRGVPPVLPL